MNIFTQSPHKHLYKVILKQNIQACLVWLIIILSFIGASHYHNQPVPGTDNLPLLTLGFYSLLSIYEIINKTVVGMTTEEIEIEVLSSELSDMIDSINQQDKPKDK